MKYFLLFFLQSFFVSAQLSNVKTNESDTKLAFNGKWKIDELNDTNHYIISGDQVINTSDKKSNRIALELYISNDNPENLNFSDENPIITKKIGRIKGDNHSKNNIKIPFQTSKLLKNNNGNYLPYIVIRDLKINSIVSIKNISYSNNNSVLNSQFDEIERKSNIKSIKYDQIDENYKTIEFVIKKPAENNLLKLYGSWQIIVDPNNFLVEIKGKENGIRNLRNTNTDSLRLALFFSHNSYYSSEEISGYELVNADLNELKANTNFNNLSIKTNILKLIPQGNYFPMLILSEKNSEGKYVIHYIKPLNGNITFKN